MATTRRPTESKKSTQLPPAATPKERENQLIQVAVDLAEKQIREGTASSQVITHFLKLGSSREKLEQERLERENSLLATRREMMESEKRVEELYAEALNAMRNYQGQPHTDSLDD